jgi:hypothetical protein
MFLRNVRSNKSHKAYHPRSSVIRLLITANVPISPILVTLMMEALNSSEISDFTRATRYHILEDGILHSCRCEKHKIFHSINRLGSVAET